jgi:hypothetical protein
MHSEIRGDAERFIELTLTQGAPATLRKLGVTDEALGVTSFRREVRAALGATTSTWLLGYRVRMAITGATGESDLRTFRASWRSSDPASMPGFETVERKRPASLRTPT